MENMVFFLAELGLMHYPTTILYYPSMIAAAAVFAAHCTLNKTPLWSETLKHYSGYSEEQIIDCAKLLVEFHSAAAESKLKVVCMGNTHVQTRVLLLLSLHPKVFWPDPREDIISYLGWFL